MRDQHENKAGITGMRINEYSSLEEFTSQFTGEWSPSDEHWFGLEFQYGGITYRLHTGLMYKEDPKFDVFGRDVLFGLYRSEQPLNGESMFVRLASFASMEDLLDYAGIADRPFREIIMDDATEILGKD